MNYSVSGVLFIETSTGRTYNKKQMKERHEQEAKTKKAVSGQNQNKQKQKDAERKKGR